MMHEFRLSPPGRGRGVSCDENGAFVGFVPLLKRSNLHGRYRWEPRDCEKLSKRLGSEFGLPVDLSTKAGGLKAICNVLNEGDVARAQIATVLLGIPEPPPLAKDTHSRSEMIRFIRELHWSGMLKADWDSSKHPRWPAGAPESQGGRFAPIWESMGAVLSEVGQAEIAESNANLAVGTAEANAIVSGLKAYANYRAQPWIGSDGVAVQVPVFNTGDSLSDRAGLMGHDLFAPNAPLERPGTNADWIDPSVNQALMGAAAAGPALRLVGAGATVAVDSSILAADTPFIILPSELPAGFDITLPIGRYVIPTNAVPRTTTYGDLVGAQIGRLVQNTNPDVPMILGTACARTYGCGRVCRSNSLSGESERAPARIASRKYRTRNRTFRLSLDDRGAHAGAGHHQGAGHRGA
jgi:hypothetical protein